MRQVRAQQPLKSKSIVLSVKDFVDFFLRFFFFGYFFSAPLLDIFEARLPQCKLGSCRMDVVAKCLRLRRRHRSRGAD